MAAWFMKWFRLSRIGRIELSILLTALITGGGAWAFLSIAEEVSEGEAHHFDTELLLALRTPGDLGDPIGPAWFEEMVRDFTALGGTGVLTLLVAVVTGFLLLQRKRRAAVFVLASVLGGQVLSSVLKHAFSRPRPDLVPHGMSVYTASFPSGHSMMAAVTFLTLGALLARVQRGRAVRLYFLSVAILLTVLVGCSRVYLGVHWPTDVLAGWAAGAAWALLCWMLALLLQRRGDLPRESASEPGSPDPEN